MKECLGSWMRARLDSLMKERLGSWIVAKLCAWVEANLVVWIEAIRDIDAMRGLCFEVLHMIDELGEEIIDEALDTDKVVEGSQTDTFDSFEGETAVVN